jgi:hypothetical protein
MGPGSVPLLHIPPLAFTLLKVPSLCCCWNFNFLGVLPLIVTLAVDLMLLPIITN